MLTREQLNIELENTIKLIDSNWERSLLTTSELLERLHDTLYVGTAQVPTRVAAFEPANLSEEQLITKRTENLRIRLREILDAETNALYRLNTGFCAKIFDLQIILARAFPLNDTEENGCFKDPITLEALILNEPLVFLSSGYVFQTASAVEFYNSAFCRNENNEYLDLNRAKLSRREHASQIAQGINLDPIPTVTEIKGRKAGLLAGKVAGWIGIFVLGMFTPAAVVFPSLLMGIAGAVFNRPLGNHWLMGFLIGYFAALVTGTLLAVACPPLMGALVAAHVISSSTAVTASTLWIFAILPPLVPALTILAAAVTSVLANLSLQQAAWEIAMFPYGAFLRLGASFGAKLGRAVDFILDQVSSGSRTEYDVEQQNLHSIVVANDDRIGVPIDPALRRESISSNQMINSHLNANPEMARDSMPAPSAPVAPVDQSSELEQGLAAHQAAESEHEELSGADYTRFRVS